MREIKFRAWDTDTKTMRRDVTGFEGFAGLMDGIFVDGDFRSIVRGEMIPMQFTGLHDKNGKEIYEGDIVEDETGCLATIEWVQDSSSFCVIFADEAQECGPYISRWAVVVGNIHENPELICQ